MKWNGFYMDIPYNSMFRSFVKRTEMLEGNANIIPFP